VNAQCANRAANLVQMVLHAGIRHLLPRTQ
jgi:hypothetical protein